MKKREKSLEEKVRLIVLMRVQLSAYLEIMNSDLICLLSRRKSYMPIRN